MRAKFTVYEEVKTKWSITYNLQPVTAQSSPENEEFFKTTPSGKIQVTIKAEATPARLELGKDYYIDFTEAE